MRENTVLDNSQFTPSTLALHQLQLAASANLLAMWEERFIRTKMVERICTVKTPNHQIVVTIV